MSFHRNLLKGQCHYFSIIFEISKPNIDLNNNNNDNDNDNDSNNNNNNNI